MNRSVAFITFSILLLVGCSWGTSPDKIELCKNAAEGVFCQKPGKDLKESALSCTQRGGTVHCKDTDLQRVAEPEERSAIDIEMEKNHQKKNYPELFR